MKPVYVTLPIRTLHIIMFILKPAYYLHHFTILNFKMYSFILIIYLSFLSI